MAKPEILKKILQDLGKISESDTVDPLTLTNMILNKNMKNSGFDWTQFATEQIESEDIFHDAKEKAFVTPGEYELKEEAEEPEQQATEEQAEKEPKVLSNNNNAYIMSSNPEINACPTYIQGVCRIDGRPCPFDNTDFKQCGKAFLATSGDPDNFEITLGREQAPEYIFGIKS